MKEGRANEWVSVWEESGERGRDGEQDKGEIGSRRKAPGKIGGRGERVKGDKIYQE